MDPKAEAQAEAERTFEMFMLWTKRVTITSIFFLLVVVVGCNSGVETGPNATGSGYNGEQYSPMNLNLKDNK
jgi:hypothetical protein|tara:strand:- start:299 stop:514 length:216 start_codon:yes stop_codon:yes gene_type:complete